MTEAVIDRVHELAEQENAPDLDEDGYPIFEWEIGHQIRPEHATDNQERQQARANQIGNLPEHNDEDDESDSDYEDNEYDDSDDGYDSDDYDTEGDDEDTDDDEGYNDDEGTNEDEGTIIKNELDENNNNIQGVVDATEDENSNDRENTDTNDRTQEVRSAKNDVDDDESSNFKVRSDRDDSDDDIQEARSEISDKNIIRGKRNRQTTTKPNICSFGGKRYHKNMLQIGKYKFSAFEKKSMVCIAQALEYVSIR